MRAKQLYIYFITMIKSQKTNQTKSKINKKFTPSHDTVFKKFIGKMDITKHFFSIWLPEKMKMLCSLDSLKLEVGSFVYNEMKNYQSDILYSVNTTQENSYLYCLVEHQPKPDKLIA